MTSDYRQWISTEMQTVTPSTETQDTHYIKDIFNMRNIIDFSKKIYPTRSLKYAYIAMDSKYRDTQNEQDLINQLTIPSAYRTPSWAISSTPYTPGQGVTSSYVSIENVHHMTLFNVVMPRGVTIQYNESPSSASSIAFDNITITTINEFANYQAFIGSGNRSMHFSGNNRPVSNNAENRTIYQAVNLYNRLKDDSIIMDQFNFAGIFRFDPVIERLDRLTFQFTDGIGRKMNQYNDKSTLTPVNLVLNQFSSSVYLYFTKSIVCIQGVTSTDPVADKKYLDAINRPKGWVAVPDEGNRILFNLENYVTRPSESYEPLDSYLPLVGALVTTNATMYIDKYRFTLSMEVSYNPFESTLSEL